MVFPTTFFFAKIPELTPGQCVGRRSAQICYRNWKPFRSFWSIGSQRDRYMKKRISTYILITSFILASCQDDELPMATEDQKLDYYIESFEVDGLGFDPQTKVTYEYNSEGRVTKYTVFTYNSDLGSLQELNNFVFAYVNNRVDQIKGYFTGKDIPHVEYSYEYLADGRVSKISEKNTAAGVNSVANFSYDAADNSVKVAYTFSNGGSFDYEFFNNGGNILSDKTTKGSQLCSDGEYTYDQHINPFNNLGYVDYSLTNVSANNKLTEDVNYVACAFPSLVPESYTYEYDEKGYPTIVTTFYKSGSRSAKARKELFYK